MNITVNGKKLEVSGQRLLIEELREAGYDIPSLCYAADARHEPSCMVCMVRNEATDQMLPSCAIYPSEGMCIDATSDEVTSLRRMSLELLLSDHRADCEAPCTLVCPAGIDVAKVISYYDEGRLAEAKALLLSNLSPPTLPCATCKATCEKACRRNTVDQSVSIREIIQEVAQTPPPASPSRLCMAASQSPAPPSPSKLGRFSETEKERLKQIYSQPSRCLHCACEGAAKCKLREWATKAGIKASPFGKSSSLPVKEQQHIIGRLWYEPAKCIRCGLCVYNSNDGFTFLRRGFDMQIVILEQSKKNVDERLAELCPTGALYIL
ncbi:MAG: (2Fe-2S)-binding protein [Bacteroidales bacterium]|nr:(2Fe-2S)-binding protein [Bacteroidales bacterium]